MEKTPEAKQATIYPKTITEEEYKEGWKKANQNTSSNPLGPDYHVYKCTTHNDTLTLFETIMLNIPYQTGYSPKRWRNALDVVLRKERGNLDLKKLRTIGLLEADFNFMCKYLGKWAMSKADEFKQLADEQWGSRKGYQCLGLALSKRLAIDIAAFEKSAFVLCSQDAMQCFDRISHAALAIGLKRQNLPTSAIIALITTIESMVHKVRTVFGDSSRSYGGSVQNPCQGIPQGCGIGPPGWAVISSGNLDLLRSAGYGATFETPMSHLTLNFVGYAYVDDTDQVENIKFTGESTTDVIMRMQKAVDMWEESIKTTGAQINATGMLWILNGKTLSGIMQHLPTSRPSSLLRTPMVLDNP